MTKIESILEISLLYDFYGQLLSKRQQEVMGLYHEENLSLTEIAQEFGISKQAVHDTLKKAEHALEAYENKLGLVKKLRNERQVIACIDEKIDELIENLLPTAGEGDKHVALSEVEQVKGKTSSEDDEVPHITQDSKTIEALKAIKAIINQLD